MSPLNDALTHLALQLRQHGLLVQVGPPSEAAALSLWPWWLAEDPQGRVRAAAPGADPAALPAQAMQLHCLLVAGMGGDGLPALLRAQAVLREHARFELGGAHFSLQAASVPASELAALFVAAKARLSTCSAHVLRGPG